MSKLLRTLACALLAALGFAAEARAGFISGARVIDPPAVIGRDAMEADFVFAFYEQQNQVLDQALRTDGGWIDLGTRVSSHYVIYDPTKRTRRSVTITFDSPILGVMSKGKRLRDSDWVGAEGVEYRRFRHRRYEWRDAYRISADGYSITLRLRANSPGDYLRVVTAGRTPTPPPPPTPPVDPPAVPEPGAALLFGAGALAARALARPRGR